MNISAAEYTSIGSTEYKYWHHELRDTTAIGHEFTSTVLVCLPLAGNCGVRFDVYIRAVDAQRHPIGSEKWFGRASTTGFDILGLQASLHAQRATKTTRRTSTSIITAGADRFVARSMAGTSGNRIVPHVSVGRRFT